MIHSYKNVLDDSHALFGVAGNSRMFSPPLTPSAYMILLTKGTPAPAATKICQTTKRSSGQSGFSGGGILHFTRQSRQINLFPMIFNSEIIKMPSFLYRNTDLSGSWYINNLANTHERARVMPWREHLEFPAKKTCKIGKTLTVIEGLTT